MSTMITEECINCGACEPECPNTAIYEGGAAVGEPRRDRTRRISQDIYYIVPEKCTECVGFFDQEQCAAVCPVDCCVPNPDDPETEEQLLAKARVIHPEQTFEARLPVALPQEVTRPRRAECADSRCLRVSRWYMGGAPRRAERSPRARGG